MMKLLSIDLGLQITRRNLWYIACVFPTAPHRKLGKIPNLMIEGAREEREIASH
jgi:hypothetical protein